MKQYSKLELGNAFNTKALGRVDLRDTPYELHLATAGATATDAILSQLSSFINRNISPIHLKRHSNVPNAKLIDGIEGSFDPPPELGKHRAEWTLKLHDAGEFHTIKNQLETDTYKTSGILVIRMPTDYHNIAITNWPTPALLAQLPGGPMVIKGGEAAVFTSLSLTNAKIKEPPNYNNPQRRPDQDNTVIMLAKTSSNDITMIASKHIMTLSPPPDSHEEDYHYSLTVKRWRPEAPKSILFLHGMTSREDFIHFSSVYGELYDGEDIYMVPYNQDHLPGWCRVESHNKAAMHNIWQGGTTYEVLTSLDPEIRTKIFFTKNMPKAVLDFNSIGNSPNSNSSSATLRHTISKANSTISQLKKEKTDLSNKLTEISHTPRPDLASIKHTYDSKLEQATSANAALKVAFEALEATLATTATDLAKANVDCDMLRMSNAEINGMLTEASLTVNSQNSQLATLAGFMISHPDSAAAFRSFNAQISMQQHTHNSPQPPNPKGSQSALSLQSLQK